MKKNTSLAPVIHCSSKGNPFTTQEDVVEFATELASIEGLEKKDYLETCTRYFAALTSEQQDLIEEIWSECKASA